MKIYTQKEAAQQVRVSPRSIGKLIKQGIVRPRKKTRHGRGQNWFTEDDLKRMIDRFYPIREVREIMIRREIARWHKGLGKPGQKDEGRSVASSSCEDRSVADERVSCESRSLTGEAEEEDLSPEQKLQMRRVCGEDL